MMDRLAFDDITNRNFRTTVDPIAAIPNALQLLNPKVYSANAADIHQKGHRF